MKIEVDSITHEPTPVSVGQQSVPEAVVRGGYPVGIVFSYAEAVEMLVNTQKITQPETHEPELPLEQE